ncbi:TAXI family TRAP transporter solute-binding subunit [Algihabitans albus]|uniref:TAXI family TRAP transporter solute-binding subunit n=1 Tax=Algihabitans albus TaxID=2164067 RepID=UPI000E5CDD2D|nr:TAXI family TRAP transporter solute-binding subunit [Algihabitans albus]
MRRQRLAPLLAAALLAAGPVLTSLPAMADVLTLAGGREGGLWSRIGLGLAQAVGSSAEDLTLAYVASPDGVINAKLLSQGGIDLALAQRAELAAASSGSAPFETPLGGLTAVASLGMAAPLHILMRRSTVEALEIETAGDLAQTSGLTYGMMPRDGLSAEIGLGVIEELAIVIPETERQARLVFAGLRSQLTRLRLGDIDVLLAPIQLGHAAVAEAAEAQQLTALAMEEPLREALALRFALVPSTIPTNAYAFVDAPTATVASDLVLAAKADSDPEQIEALTRSLFENLNQLRAVHPRLSGLTVQQLASIARAEGAPPLHPGAEAYLMARGLIPEPPEATN